MKAHEFAGWTTFALCWIGMEAVALRLLNWLGAQNLPREPLSQFSWSWELLLIHGLTFFAAAALMLFVVEGVQADAKKEKA